MLIKMLQLIGENVVEEKSELEMLIDEQKSYKSKYILTVGIDPFNQKTEHVVIESEEYDNHKKLSYLRGTVGSGGSSYSPTLNINLPKLKGYKLKNEFKTEIPSQIEWEKYFDDDPQGKKFLDLLLSSINLNQNLVKILKKEALKDKDKNDLTKKLFLWIEENIFILTKNIFYFLFDHFMSVDNEGKIKVSKDAPNSIIICPIENGRQHYPGELDSFKDLYLRLYRDKLVDSSYLLTCYTCSKSTTKLHQPTIGIFNLNMQGFVIGFQNEKNSVQFSVCTDCDAKIRKGLDFVDKNLSFYAYKSKKGAFGRDGVNIFHYIIPIIHEPPLLKKAVKRIIKGKEDFGEKRKISMIKRINILNDQLKSVSRAKQKSIKTEIKNYEKQASRSVEELGQNIDLLDIITRLSEHKVNYLDIYYFVTDTKQNPTTKELIGFYQLSETIITRISDTTNQMRQFGKTFQFYKIRELISEKLFLSLMNALYNQKLLPREKFVEQSNKTTLDSFQNRLFDQGKPIQSHSYLLRYFKHSFEFLILNGVFTN